MRAQQPSPAAGSVPRSGHVTERVVDYSLRRRAVLREVYSGRVGVFEVCDASPYLKSAAKYHGEATERPCPICRREFVTLVHYIYGDQLKHAAGQARSRKELAALAGTLGRTSRRERSADPQEIQKYIQVYIVEVCRGCDWNFLVEQQLLVAAGGEAGSAAADAPLSRTV